MKLSTKGRYAVVALSDMALLGNDKFMRLADISSRQKISFPYLEQLFVKLRKAGLINSTRGPGGGYQLAKSASEIRVSEILAAVDEPVNALDRGAGVSGGQSGTKAQSLSNRLWESLSAQVYVFLHNICLADIVENNIDPCPAVPDILNFVDE